MPTSKLSVSALLVFSSIALLLGACNPPAPQSREGIGSQQAATFLISDISGQVLPAKTPADFGVRKSKEFSFQVCVKDAAQSRPLVGHPFVIEETGKESRTNDKGCVVWTEEIPYNFFSTPKYLEWTRTLRATGLHKGRQQASFAINPWSENDSSAPAVVDLRNSPQLQVVQGTEAVRSTLSGAGSSGPKNTLWVSEMRLQSTEQKFVPGGVLVNVELMANPQWQVLTLSGEKEVRKIPQGRFRVQVSLLHSLVEQNQEVHRLLAEAPPQEISLYNGNLFIKAPLTLTKIPTRGQLLVGLDISAETGSGTLGRFQGVYMIGDYDQIKTTGFLRLMSVVSETPDFSLKTFVNSEVKDGDAYVSPRIEVAPLEFHFVRVGKESTTERELIYNVKACLKNGIEQKNIRGYTFMVKGFQTSEGTPRKQIKITTDNSACLNWDDSLTFKYYDCQRHLKGFIEIENQDLAVNQRLEVAMNPWATYGPLGRDLRYVDDKESLGQECQKGASLPSTLSLRSLNYSTLSYGYEIDPALNLSFKKKLRLKIDAVVSILNDMGSGRMESAQRLRPGVYLLKLAVVKNRDYYNEKTYVASAEKLIATLDGDLKTDLELKTADLKALADRSTLLVELDPVAENKVQVDPSSGQVSVKGTVKSLDEVIDSSSRLNRATFSAGFLLNLDRDTQDLTLLDPATAPEFLLNVKRATNTSGKSVVRSYIELGQKLSAERAATTMAPMAPPVFAQTNSLQFISAADPGTYGGLQNSLRAKPTAWPAASVPQALRAFATTGKLEAGLAQGLCAYWFRDLIKKDLGRMQELRALLSCGLHAQTPENVFAVEKRLFVKELGNYRFERGYNQSLSVGQNLTLSNSHSKSQSAAKSLSMKMELAQKFADIFTIGIGGSYTISETDSDSDSVSHSTSLSANMSLLLQQNNYRLQLKRYQECAIVRLQPQQFLKKGLFSQVLKSSYSNAEKAAVATRGLLVCTGQDNTQPLVREEKYYLLTQETGSSQMQDSGDARNRNFFIALRGEKEFERLLYFLRSALPVPGKESRTEPRSSAVPAEALERLFRTGLPNAPGTLSDMQN